MNLRCAALLALSLLASLQGVSKGHVFKIHTDYPFLNSSDALLLDVFYDNDSIFHGKLDVQVWKFDSNDDSTIVLSKRNAPETLKAGTNKIILNFTATDSNTAYNQKFYEILKRTGGMAPGSYKILLTVKTDSEVYQATYLHGIDSLLPATSPVRRDINKSLVPRSKSFLGMRLQKAIAGQTAGAEKAFVNARGKVDKAIKKRGLESEHYEKNGKSFVDLYYDGWFAGRYEVNNKEPLSKQLTGQEKQADAGNKNTDIDHPSLYSQYKKQNQDKKDKEETKGEIGMTTNMATGQEPYSGVDNNYIEVRGRLETYVSGIPVELEGLYTTQDLNREIKSSYFKIHYDVEKMKEDLNRSMRSYNNKYAETRSKGTGMQQVYMTSISNLEGQKAVLQNEINKEAGGLAAAKPDTKATNGIASGVKKEATDTSGVSQLRHDGRDSADTVSSNKSSTPGTDSAANSLKNRSAEQQAKLDAKRKRLEELDRKIEKYKLLLAQNENTNHFDSLVGYNKTKTLGSQDDMTYKQMAKKGDALLPDGQAKGFIAGVTHFDAGMFPKEESKYTMGGQMMKGIDLGYDLGICQTAATLGKTEYVGRDGSLDKYTCYSERTTFKTAKRQKLSLIYYGYTADRKVTGDAFFNNAGISAPGFFEPVHIVSAKYDATVSNYVTASGEVATSFRNSDNTDVPAPSLASKMAYHLNVDGSIPNTAIKLESSYNKTGLNFTNNTLPMSLSGTEQYRLAAKDDLFRHLVTAGVEYDVLNQTNLESRSASKKWGFDTKTNFKRYPNIALSYKPFTTFRSISDTFNIPQRPLFGSVWTAKASYQIKMKERSLRFMILYNRCMTTMDSTTYGSKMAQVSTIYTDKSVMASVNIGYTQVTGVDTATIVTSPNKMTFLSLTGSYLLSKQLSISCGNDYGLASFGFCKFGLNGGCTYRPAKKPYTIRLNMRYTTYELTRYAPWQNLYSGNIDVAYRFKMKKTKNSF